LAVLAWAALAGGLAWGQAPKAHVEHETPEGKTKAEKAEKTGHAHTPSALEHVSDSNDWELFDTLGIHIPLGWFTIAGYRVPTKFMLLELIAAGLILAIYIPLAQRLRTGEPPRGWWDHCFEVLLTFVREEVAKPAIGEHDADRYVPFLWTMFLFILFNNLLGMLPFGASPTGQIYVTGALAVCVFFAIHGSAVAKMGFGHYLLSLFPHMDVPLGMKIILVPFVFVIEVIGVLVRNAVLAVRLFANMFAGHMVLATILLFILMAGHQPFGLWGTITATSVLGIVLLSLLEIFVAFLQAYVFVFLAALFMGMAMHPQH
jgi:F-type H+-transporting ATPase subunit a